MLLLRYLEIWHLLFVPHRTYTNREGDKLFPFLHYRNQYVPKTYFTLFYYSLYFLTPSFFPFGALRTDRRTEKILHPLLPRWVFFFSTERAGPYPQAQLSTGLAELWGGWPIEQGQKESATYLRWNSTYDGDLQYIRLINLKRHIDYFSKGPKSSRTDRARKRRSFRVNSILSFCHNDKHETQHVGQLISIKGHTI
jgi:hypothetical protein